MDAKRQPRTAIDHAGRLAIYAGALVGGWLLGTRVFQSEAEHYPWAMVFVIALAAGATFGAYVLQERISERRDHKIRADARAAGDNSYAFVTSPIDRTWLPPVVIVGVLCAFGISAGWRSRDNYIRPFCLYGAQSQAQLDHCMTHVSSDYINGLDTQAAEFARGNTSECLDDSGPFCQDASKWNTVDPPSAY